MIKKIIAISFLFLILAIWWFGLYPAAAVNLNPIFKRDFDEKTKVAVYLNGALNNADETNEKIQEEEIRKKVLTSMIQEKLLEEIAKEKLPAHLTEIKDSVAQKLQNLSSSPLYDQIKKSSKALFGSEFDAVYEKFQKPIAYKDSVQEIVVSSGTDFQSWFFEGAEEEKVHIFLPSYAWDKNKLEVVDVKAK